MPLPAIERPVSRHRRHSRAASAALLVAIALLQPVQAATPSDDAKGPVVPVKYVYASMNNDRSVGQRCWQTLLPQRDLLIRQENAKPFYFRNMMPLIGAVMGGAAGALLLKRIASANTAKTWMLPVVAGTGIGGYFAGPGGVTGAVIGGGVADKLGKHNLAVTVAVSMGGLAVGKALWDMVFPPAVPPAPPTDPEGDIPIETFIQDTVCGPELLTSHEMSTYRVGYRFNDEDYDVDLPYDPGEALQLDVTGKAVSRARLNF